MSGQVGRTAQLALTIGRSPLLRLLVVEPGLVFAGQCLELGQDRSDGSIAERFCHAGEFDAALVEGSVAGDTNGRKHWP